VAAQRIDPALNLVAEKLILSPPSVGRSRPTKFGCGRVAALVGGGVGVDAKHQRPVLAIEPAGKTDVEGGLFSVKPILAGRRAGVEAAGCESRAVIETEARDGGAAREPESVRIR
jgi:hypothetical protein